MQLTLAYGRTGLPVDLPDGCTTVVSPRPRPAMTDPAGALAAALRRPLAGPALRDLARPGGRVVVSVCDGTRAQPRQVMVEAVLAALDGVVDPGDVTVLVATGAHRPNTPPELRSMLGAGILSTCRVLNHDSSDPSGLVDLGTVGDGVPAALNRLWVEADLRVSTGFVEPHFFAGFSGGPKMVAPGLAGRATIHELHSARRIGHPLATWGVVEGNPVQEGLRAVMALAPPHLSLDVVMNASHEITAVFAGEVLAEHAAACEEARRAAMQPVHGPFDVVVTSNSGYPLDQSLYQAVKGMAAAAAVVRDGGLVICAAECSDGLPDGGAYAAMLSAGRSPGELLYDIERAAIISADQWQVQVQARIQARARVAVKSDRLSDRALLGAQMQPVADVGEAVRHELATIGGGTVCVLPDGPQSTVPHLAPAPGRGAGAS